VARGRLEEQAKLTDEIRRLQAEINASMKQSTAEADEYKRSHLDENIAEVEARFNQDASAQERGREAGAPLGSAGKRPSK
jgi:hypothetical protein